MTKVEKYGIIISEEDMEEIIYYKSYKLEKMSFKFKNTLFLCFFVFIFVNFCFIEGADCSPFSFASYDEKQPINPIVLEEDSSNTQPFPDSSKAQSYDIPVYEYGENSNLTVSNLYSVTQDFSSYLDNQISFYEEEMSGLDYIDDIMDVSYLNSLPYGEILQANESMLDDTGWIDANRYFDYKNTDGQANTLIIEFDTGISTEHFPELENAIFPGWDVIGDDIIASENSNVSFSNKHGTHGAQILAALSSESKIMPVKIAKASDWNVTLANLQIGMEKAMSNVEYIKEVTGKEYNVVVNIPVSFWLNSYMKDEMIDYWESDYGKERLFFLFKEELLSSDNNLENEVLKSKQQDIKYNDVMNDEELLNEAIEWLFNGLYVEGNLSPKLNSSTGGVGAIFSKMQEMGWKVVVPGTESNYGEKVYPAGMAGIESAGRINYRERGIYNSYKYGDWTELVVPDEFRVHDAIEDEYYTSRGSCVSAFMLSALYAKLWEVAPNLDKEELDKIIKGTADQVNQRYSQKIIRPYYAVRTSWVYGKIKQFAKAYEQGDMDFETLKNETESVLKDLEGDNFYSEDMMNSIFLFDSSQIESMDNILDSILVKAEELQKGTANSETADYLRSFISSMFDLERSYFDAKWQMRKGGRLKDGEEQLLKKTKGNISGIEDKLVELTQLMEDFNELKKAREMKEEIEEADEKQENEVPEDNSMQKDSTQDADDSMVEKFVYIREDANELEERFQMLFDKKTVNLEEGESLLSDIGKFLEEMNELKKTSEIIYNYSAYNLLSNKIKDIRVIERRIQQAKSEEKGKFIFEETLEVQNEVSFEKYLGTAQDDFFSFLYNLQKEKSDLKKQKDEIEASIEDGSGYKSYLIDIFFEYDEEIRKLDKLIVKFQTVEVYINTILENVDLDKLSETQKEELIAVIDSLEEVKKDIEKNIFGDKEILAEDIDSLVESLAKFCSNNSVFAKEIRDVASEIEEKSVVSAVSNGDVNMSMREEVKKKIGHEVTREVNQEMNHKVSQEVIDNNYEADDDVDTDVNTDSIEGTEDNVHVVSVNTDADNQEHKVAESNNSVNSGENDVEKVDKLSVHTDNVSEDLSRVSREDGVSNKGGDNVENGINEDGYEDFSVFSIVVRDSNMYKKFVQSNQWQDNLALDFKKLFSSGGILEVVSTRRKSNLCDELSNSKYTGLSNLPGITESMKSISQILDIADEKGLSSMAVFLSLSLLPHSGDNAVTYTKAGRLVSKIVGAFDNPDTKYGFYKVLKGETDPEIFADFVMKVSNDTGINEEIITRLFTADRKDITDILTLAARDLKGDDKVVLSFMIEFLNGVSDDEKNELFDKLPPFNPKDIVRLLNILDRHNNQVVAVNEDNSLELSNVFDTYLSKNTFLFIPTI